MSEGKQAVGVLFAGIPQPGRLTMHGHGHGRTAHGRPPCRLTSSHLLEVHSHSMPLPPGPPLLPPAGSPATACRSACWG